LKEIEHGTPEEWEKEKVTLKTKDQLKLNPPLADKAIPALYNRDRVLGQMNEYLGQREPEKYRFPLFALLATPGFGKSRVLTEAAELCSKDELVNGEKNLFFQKLPISITFNYFSPIEDHKERNPNLQFEVSIRMLFS
jgi:hypothetical protein